MRFIPLSLCICATLFCSSAVAPPRLQAQSPKSTPLILEKDQGERRVWRPIEGLDSQLSLFILKVDPENGGSSRLIMGTEDIPVGGKIDPHRHPDLNEIVFLQNGSARVFLGDVAKDVHSGATVYIPAGTWISVANTGSEAIHAIFIFDGPGFDEFMRAESVREAEKVMPLTKAEDAAILAKHTHAVVYKEP